jgi:hypothetical protein
LLGHGECIMGLTDSYPPHAFITADWLFSPHSAFRGSSGCSRLGCAEDLGPTAGWQRSTRTKSLRRTVARYSPPSLNLPRMAIGRSRQTPSSSYLSV